MKTLHKVFVVSFVAIIAGCSPTVQDTVVESRIVNVEVVDIDPPKRYRVTFKNLETEQVVKEYISKRCSSHHKIQVGQKHQLEMVIKQKADGQKYVEYNNLKKVFCPG